MLLQKTAQGIIKNNLLTILKRKNKIKLSHLGYSRHCQIAAPHLAYHAVLRELGGFELFGHTETACTFPIVIAQRPFLKVKFALLALAL